MDQNEKTLGDLEPLMTVKPTKLFHTLIEQGLTPEQVDREWKNWGHLFQNGIFFAALAGPGSDPCMFLGRLTPMPA